VPVKSKPERFSYTKVDTYNQCGWKYKLQYVEGRFFSTETIATALGTLIHLIEQRISEAYINGQEPDYPALVEDFWNINIPKKDKYDRTGGIQGVNYIRQKFQEEFFAIDKHGSSYAIRCKYYAEEGIYRQKKFLEEHPEIEIVDVEKYFEVMFKGHLLSGYIDRVMRYKGTNRYIIDDIKTKAAPFNEKTEVPTPLQMKIYSLALKSCYNLENEPDECYWDLPFINMRQRAGTKGWLKRAETKLNKLFAGIESQDWTPRPSPLCHWCNFCGTNPNQPQGARHLCPYQSQWQRDNPTYDVLNEWQGIENHEKVMRHYLLEQCVDLTDEERENIPPDREAIKKKYKFTF
jgi:hypothetical protein